MRHNNNSNNNNKSYDWPQVDNGVGNTQHRFALRLTASTNGKQIVK